MSNNQLDLFFPPQQSNTMGENFNEKLLSQPAPIPENVSSHIIPPNFNFINSINPNEVPNQIQPNLPKNEPMNVMSPNPINKINNNNNNTINVNSEKAQKTKLENKFSFWYRIDDIIQFQLQKQALDKKDYEVQVKKIAEFDTVEDFWGIFQHLRKPDSCRPGIEYFMFKEPIKPMWEDESNRNGGRISIKLRKDFTTIIWEEMIFTLIGGILPKEMKDEINGIVVTSRKEYNTLQIWFKTYEDDIIADLEQCIRDLLVIPPEVNLEIKQFYKSNFKKEFPNNTNNNIGGINMNNKKSGLYFNNKGYNINFYGEPDYEYHNKDKNDFKKKMFQNHKINK